MKAITKDLEFCGIYMLLNTKNGKRYVGISKKIKFHKKYMIYLKTAV